MTSDEIDLEVNLLAIGVESEGIAIRLVKSLDTSIRKNLGTDQTVFHPKILSILVTEDVEGSVIIARKIIMKAESIAAETNRKNAMIEIQEMTWPHTHISKRKIQIRLCLSKEMMGKVIFSGMDSNGCPVSVRRNILIPCRSI